MKSGFRLILAINAAVFAITSLFPELMGRFALFSNAAPLRFLATLITHQFTHANFPHFFYNMFFAAPFALFYEKRVGRDTFIRHWLICGIGAAMFYMTMPSLLGGSSGAMLGASGAISGIFALAMLSYNKDFIGRLVALVFLIGLFYSDLLPGIMDCFLPSGVAHMAHVGGMLTGCLLFCLSKTSDATKADVASHVCCPAKHRLNPK